MSKTPKPPITPRDKKLEEWAKRRAQIIDHREAGWSYGDISRKFGISRTRAQQIVKEATA